MLKLLKKRRESKKLKRKKYSRDIGDYQSKTVLEWHKKLLAEKTAVVNSSMDTTPQVVSQPIGRPQGGQPNRTLSNMGQVHSPARGSIPIMGILEEMMVIAPSSHPYGHGQQYNTNQGPPQPQECDWIQGLPQSQGRGPFH